MSVKRMRIFAGPNGSGKTTIVNDLKNKIQFGVYVNADDIEANLKQYYSLNFNEYKLQVTSEEFKKFIIESNFSIKINGEEYFLENIEVNDNQILIRDISLVNSYFAADIAEFIRQQLLKQDSSFTYETVMSHSAKIDFIKLAKSCGYRTYLYFIATEDPEININRVSIRVAQSGHNVHSAKIEDRYYRSLQNLKEAVKQTDRTYLFDNSGKTSLLIAEVTDGKDVKIIDTEFVPN